VTETAALPAPHSKLARPVVWLAWGLALAATAAYSIAPPVARAAILSGMDPTTLLMARLVISTALLGGTLLLTARQRVQIDRRGLIVCTVAGLSNGVGMLTFFWSLTRIDSSVASMIFALSPLVALGMLALRGEKFTYRNTFRVGLGTAGVYLLIGPGGQVDWLGVGLALVSAFTVPFHLILIQWYLQGYDSRTVTLYMVAAMTAVVSAWWLVQGAQWNAPGLQGWIYVVVLAVVSTYLARLAMFVAILGIGGGQMALLAPLETLLTVIWSGLFLAERLAPLQWAGGSLILLSAVLAVRRLRRARQFQTSEVLETSGV